MKRIRKALLSIILLAAVAFGALTWLASSRLICPPRRTLQDYHQDILANAREHGMRIESFLSGVTPCLLCEPVANPGAAVKGNKLRAELQSMGVVLAPWGDVKATLMLLHGHTGCKEDHLPVAERFCAAGFRCLLPDLPGHGQHPMPFASFGKTESTLPGEVLRDAASKFHFTPTPAALFGISQGGAISLQAAARVGERWFAVAELSSFATLDLVVQKQAKSWFGPLAPLAAGAVTMLVNTRAGYAPADIRPLDAAATLTMPVLIGHGDADVFVTPDQARLIYDVVPSLRKQFFNIPGAGHSNTLITNAPVYSTVARFFIDALATP